MAAKKKSGKSRAGSATATKIQNSAARKEAVQGRRQLLSVIWFAVAVFLLCVVFIPGQNVWLAIHNFIFGVFGVTAYFYPFLLGFVAVLFAMDKIGGSMNAKVIESGILVILVGAAVDIFSKHNDALTFWQHLTAAYKSGSHLKSGGFLGALAGSATLPCVRQNGRRNNRNFADIRIFNDNYGHYAYVAFPHYGAACKEHIRAGGKRLSGAA